MLTDEQKKNYLEKRGLYCPMCGSRNIEATGRTNTDEQWHEVDVKCNRCEVVWIDFYKLVDVRVVSIPTKKN